MNSNKKHVIAWLKNLRFAFLIIISINVQLWQRSLCALFHFELHLSIICLCSNWKFVCNCFAKFVYNLMPKPTKSRNTTIADNAATTFTQIPIYPRWMPFTKSTRKITIRAISSSNTTHDCVCTTQKQVGFSNDIFYFYQHTYKWTVMLNEKLPLNKIPMRSIGKIHYSTVG